MRREKWFSALEGGLLAFSIAFGGCGCMVSGFDMQVSMTTVALCCGVCVLILSVCFAFGQWIPALCALALTGGYLFQSQKAIRGIEALLNQVSRFYNMAYDCGTVRWSSQALTTEDLTVGVCLVGGLVTLILCLVVCRRRSAFFGILTALAPLAACLVVTDTVPGMAYLFLLLLGVLLLLLTQTTRQKSAIQGARLLALLALPTALALALLFWAVPQDGYTGQDNAERAANTIVNWVQGLTLSEEQPWQALGLDLDAGGQQEDRVDLSEIGPQTMGTDSVMTVKAPQTGPMYLRGCSFDTYDGKSWTNSGNPNGELTLWPDEKLETVGEVTVTTRSIHPVMYFPYYPGEIDWQQFTDGKLPNTENLTTYSFTQLRVPGGYSGWWSSGSFGLEPFLTLPEKTRAGAEEILSRIFPDGIADLAYFSRETASAIAAYVRGSASYDLGTERMPGNADDFALWFLEESDTGYCVHFATAATVLLRAAGIPARYVTGYLVEGKAEKTVTVRQENAHAWVEFYMDGVGWTLLEATPGVSESQDSQEAPADVQPSWPEEGMEPSKTESFTVATGKTDAGNGPEESQPPASGRVSGVLKAAIWIAALAAVVLSQWRLRLYLRRNRQRRGNPNAQALARWQEAVLLSRLLDEMPDMDLFHLAQKAKYSPYTLSQEELFQFDDYLAAARGRLRQKPLPMRLIDRLVFAAY